jgi:hypothetical protein
MARHADPFSAACVVQNVGEVVANMGDRQRQALHAPNFSKKNACFKSHLVGMAVAK